MCKWRSFFTFNFLPPLPLSHLKFIWDTNKVNKWISLELLLLCRMMMVMILSCMAASDSDGWKRCLTSTTTQTQLMLHACVHGRLVGYAAVTSDCDGHQEQRPESVSSLLSHAYMARRLWRVGGPQGYKLSKGHITRRANIQKCSTCLRNTKLRQQQVKLKFMQNVLELKPDKSEALVVRSSNQQPECCQFGFVIGICR